MSPQTLTIAFSYMAPLLIFLLGLCVGSFINVIIYRCKKNESFLYPRSYCPKCKKQLAAKDLIPAISFLLQKGQCRYCNDKISIEYLIVEITTAIIFLSIFFVKTSMPLLSIIDWVKYAIPFIFSFFLIIIFIYDLKYQFILDKITVPAMLIAFGLNLIIGRSPLDLLYGALACGGFFALQFLISRGKWIGGGDIRLGILIGFMLGFKLSIAALFIAYLAGGLAGIYLLAAKKKHLGSKIPFGTFLALATFISMLWGKIILNYYVHIIL